MRRTKAAPLAAALLVGACSGGTNQASAPDASGDWMDGATVLVARSASTGRETVTLRDEASGFEQVMEDEALTPDADELDDENGDPT